NGALTFSGFGTAQGGSLADTFNVTAATTLNLKGGGGADTFTIDAALTGSVDGEAGSDTLQGTQIVDVTLTGSGANGYAGGVATTANLSGGFAGINVLNGSGTLTGENAVSTWALGASKTYDDGAGNGALTFSGFGTAQGGSLADTFNVTAATTLNLKGGGGADTFTIDAALTGSVYVDAALPMLQGTQIVDVTLTGSGANGYAGGVATTANLS